MILASVRALPQAPGREEWDRTPMIVRGSNPNVDANMSLLPVVLSVAPRHVHMLLWALLFEDENAHQDML